MSFDRTEESYRSRARAGFALALPLKNFAPPLQPNLPRHCFAREIAHSRRFKVERIQGVKARATLHRREQRCDKTIPIRTANKLGAIRKRVLHDTRHHSTAISPAPTRRPSISITL